MELENLPTYEFRSNGDHGLSRRLDFFLFFLLCFKAVIKIPEVVNLFTLGKVIEVLSSPLGIIDITVCILAVIELVI